MQNDISNKIRLLLNELAILNQPDVFEGKFFYNPTTLLRLKHLTSELYLLTDQLLAGAKEPAHFEPVHDKAKSAIAENEPVVSPPLQEDVVVLVPEPPAPVPVIVTPVHPPEPTPEPETIASPPPVAVPEIKHTEPVAETKPEPEKPSPPAGLKPANDLFDGKISFTRRFEYVNNLFGGDGGAFATFLNEISASPDREAAMHIFDTTFEQRNWKRKSETSDDLKQLIKKVK